MLSGKGYSELLWALPGPMLCEGLGVWGGGCCHPIRAMSGRDGGAMKKLRELL